MAIIPRVFAEERSHRNRSEEVAPAEQSTLMLSSSLPHKVRDLSDADSALDARISAIRSLEAGDEIAIESYIFAPDKVGKLILRLLVQKKRELGRALKVRILADGFPFQNDMTGLDPVMARALEAAGIEFKFYNRGTILNVTRAVRRDHRKLFIVKKKDKDALVITGGRNIADEYFNQNKKYNFIDRDIQIEGPLGNEILKSFDAQFNDRLARPVPQNESKRPSLQTYLNGASPKGRELAESNYRLAIARYELRMARAKSVLNPSESDQESDDDFRNGIHAVAATRELSNPTRIANNVSFFSDPPGLKFSEHTSAQVMSRELRRTKESLLIENFQYSPKGELKKTMNKLARNQVAITTHTNGKGASEYGILYYFTYRGEKAATKVNEQNFRFYNFDGRAAPYSDASETLPPENVRAIIHSKSVVIDGKDSIVSTFNFSARSAFLNTECGIIVRDQPELAATISDSTWERMKNSKAFEKNSVVKSAPGFVYQHIIGPLSTLIEDNF